MSLIADYLNFLGIRLKKGYIFLRKRSKYNDKFLRKRWLLYESSKPNGVFFITQKHIH